VEEPRSRGSLLLHRYVFREVLSPFLLALFVFTGILFLARSLKLVDLVVNKDVPLWEIAELFLLIVPQFMEIAIPMALLIGLIMAFSRLSADSELVVMRSAGVSIRQLTRPVILFALICALICLVLSLWVRPWANYRLGVGMFEMAKQRTSAGLTPGVFNEFGALSIYAEKIDSGKLTKVSISDRRASPRNFIARHGQLMSDEYSRTITLRLFDGSIHEGWGLNYNMTYFDINNIVLQQDELIDGDLSKSGKKANEMYLPELRTARNTIREAADTRKEELKAARYEVELHRRFVIPVSCLAVAFLGMALGVQPSKGGHSWGLAANVAVGILVVTVYYFVLAFSTALGEEALVPPWFIMWVPNVLFGLFAFFIFRRIESEEWLAVSQTLGDFFARLSSHFRLVRA
jgi:lipopolysaccharide export system permease protein